MTDRLLAISLVAAASLTVAACSQSLQTTYNNQEEDIAEYAASIRYVECNLTTEINGTDTTTVRTVVDTIAPVVTLNGGATRLTIVGGSGEELSPTGRATIYFTGYTFTSGPSWMDFARVTTDGENATWLFSYPTTQFLSSSTSRGLTLFATNHQATAVYIGWDLTDGIFEPLTVDLGSGDLVEGLQHGLAGVRAGEVCEILFSGRYGFGNRILGTIPANSAVLYRIWVESISN